MRSKKVTPYDAEEQRLQTQSASIMDFLKRKGVVEDVKIDDETVRKAQKTKAQKAYHKGYTEMLVEARQIATKRMVDEAEAMGADAIVNIRVGSSAVMQGAAEVIAYGTAVKLK